MGVSGLATVLRTASRSARVKAPLPQASSQALLLASSVARRWGFGTRAYSAKAGAGNDVIGIDLGTTNSCVAVMEGK
eukprot:c19101_g2_i1 orf=1-228(-)